MTKSDVLKQVYELSVNGNFNRENGWSFSKFKSSWKLSCLMDGGTCRFQDLKMDIGIIIFQIQKKKIKGYTMRLFPNWKSAIKAYTIYKERTVAPFL